MLSRKKSKAKSAKQQKIKMNGNEVFSSLYDAAAYITESGLDRFGTCASAYGYQMGGVISVVDVEKEVHHLADGH